MGRMALSDGVTLTSRDKVAGAPDNVPPKVRGRAHGKKTSRSSFQLPRIDF